MEIEFPLEFLVRGTPVSKRAQARSEWEARVRTSSQSALPDAHFATDRRLSLLICHFPDGPADLDLDNLVKPILDALKGHIYIDDLQVDRLTAQRFEPGQVFAFTSPSAELSSALTEAAPLVYIRMSYDPFEDQT